MKSLPVKVHLSSRAPCPPLPSTPVPSTPLPPLCRLLLSISMHTVCEVGQLNWIGPLSLDYPGVAVRQCRVAPVADVISMGRCYIQHTYSIQSIVFRKKYRTMERKKRSKGSVWEFSNAEKKFGKFEEEMKAYGQKMGQILHTHTHSAKLVVRMNNSRSWWVQSTAPTRAVS